VNACEECGAKVGRGGRVLMHRKGCSLKVVKKKPVEELSEIAKRMTEVTSEDMELLAQAIPEPFVPVLPPEPEAPVLHKIHAYCKGCYPPVKMRRLNCGGMTHRAGYSSCKHGIGLEYMCEECRKVQHGRLSWVCPKCGVEWHEGRQAPSMNYEIRGEVKFGA